MDLKEVTITHRDSCKTYPLKRVGLSHLINWENDTPTIKDLCESKDFEHLEEPEIGCILIWKYKTNVATEGYWIPHKITESGKVVSLRAFDYGHCAVYETENMISDVSWEEGWGTILRMRNYNDLSKPDYILKYVGKSIIEPKLMIKNALNWILGILNDHHIKYRISGGLAAKIYGADRPLADIDIDVESLSEIRDEIKPYIIMDGRCKDNEWDCELITLNYNGQEIDLVVDAKIYDKNKSLWVDYNINFNNLTPVNYIGENVVIISREELIAYKSKLLRDVDVFDIKSII